MHLHLSINGHRAHFTHVCIKLHNCNLEHAVVGLWNPFYILFVHLRRRWESTASIITTFLLLSFSKILFGSFTLLHTYPSKIMSDCALYYDPTAECDSQDYTIFSAVACVGNIWLQYVIWLLAGRAPLYSLACICSTCDDRCQFPQVMISTKFLIVVLHNLICGAIQVLCRVCFSLVGWCKVLDDAMLVNNAQKGNWCLDMQLQTVW